MGPKNASKRSLGPIIGMTVFGLVALAIGVFMTQRSLHDLSVRERAIGRVVSVEKVPGRKGTTFRPTFEYTAPDGSAQVQSTQEASKLYDFAIGEEKEILVDPAHQEPVRINSFSGLWLVPICCFGFGGLLSAAGSWDLLSPLIKGRTSSTLP